MLGCSLQTAVDIAARAPPLQLADANAIYLGRGHGWNDYQAMAVDGSLTRSDFGTVIPKERMHRPTPAVFATDAWSGGVVVRLATATDDTVDRYVWAGSITSFGLNWRFSRFRFLYDGAFVDSVAPPSLSTTPQDYYIVCSVEPNPATTGPLDATIRRTRVWNLDTNEFVEVSNIGVIGPSSTDLTVGALSTGGAGSFTGDVAEQAAVRYFRICDRARQRAELENTRPLVASWPTPTPLASLQTGLRFFPSMATLVDPISTEVGVASGTTYDAALDARDFDGIDDQIQWANPADLTGLPISASVWVRQASNATAQYFFELDSASADSLKLLTFVTPARLVVNQNFTITDAERRAFLPLAIDQWTHLVQTYAGGLPGTDLKLYQDGVEMPYDFTAAGVGTRIAADGPLTLGRHPTGTPFPFHGSLTDARTWDRVLTAAEVYNLWQSSRNL